MRKEHIYYIYIVSNHTGTIYIGVTNDLLRRVGEHKNGKFPGFTKKYGCNKLIYYEMYAYIQEAIDREKQLKKWNRSKKEKLIKTMNPHWNDLYNELIRD